MKQSAGEIKRNGDTMAVTSQPSPWSTSFTGCRGVVDGEIRTSTWMEQPHHS